MPFSAALDATRPFACHCRYCCCMCKRGWCPHVRSQEFFEKEEALGADEQPLMSPMTALTRLGSPRLQVETMFRKLKPSPSEVIDLSDLESPPKLNLPEFEAKCNTLATTGPAPSHADLLELMPPCLLSANTGERFLCAGSNPRSPVSLSVLNYKAPFFVKVVNRFLSSLAPHFKYTSFVVRDRCMSRPHRDCRNGAQPSLLVSLTPTQTHEGLWIQDPVGTHCREHLGSVIMGSTLSIYPKPIVFDARRRLHAGCPSPSRRVVLTAFSTMHVSILRPIDRWLLVEQGFPVPDPHDISQYLFETLHEPRVRQRTLLECLRMPVAERDVCEVIEICSESESGDSHHASLHIL